jgi:hypothetical protein
VSVQAIAWVLEDCPDLPKHLVATLMGLANHADHDGRGAFPTQVTLAWYTRKNERSVRRDLEELEALKLIEPGDQRMVLHIPPDRRPVVYNLATHLKREPRPRPGKSGRPAKPAPAQNRGDVDVRPVAAGNRGDVDVRADVDVITGGTSASDRGDVDVRLTVLEPPKEPTPPTPHAPVTPQPGGTEPAPEPQPALEVDGDPRRTPALVALAAELAAAGGWDTPTTEHVMLDLLGRGRAVDEIVQVLRAAATGAYGQTGSPRRFISWWPPTMAVSAPEPSWVRGPIAYLDPDRERCRRHPSEPSGTCGRCRSETLAVVDPEPVVPAGDVPGPRGRELARLIASGARTPARVLTAVA